MDVGTLDITELLYEVLNDEILTNEITGDIFQEAEFLNDNNENVIIMTPHCEPSRYRGVQNGLANVNIEVPGNSNGTPKIDREKELANIVRNLLNIQKLASKGFYFNILNEQHFREQKQNISYYYNFKLKINT